MRLSDRRKAAEPGYPICGLIGIILQVFPVRIIMLVVIDNYDSFTYNLVQYLGELGAEMKVIRNDEIDVERIASELKPERILISPGPGVPSGAGITMDAIKRFEREIPILGVCLGHQAIGEVYGGKVVRAPVPVHGKPGAIRHDSRGIFEGLPQDFEAGRYHSLIIERDSVPECLEVTAETEDGLVMGLRHREFDIEGVQFHPESILTTGGRRLLGNFLGMGR